MSVWISPCAPHGSNTDDDMYSAIILGFSRLRSYDVSPPMLKSSVTCCGSTPRCLFVIFDCFHINIHQIILLYNMNFFAENCNRFSFPSELLLWRTLKSIVETHSNFRRFVPGTFYESNENPVTDYVHSKIATLAQLRRQLLELNQFSGWPMLSGTITNNWTWIPSFFAFGTSDRSGNSQADISKVSEKENHPVLRVMSVV